MVMESWSDNIRDAIIVSKQLYIRKHVDKTKRKRKRKIYKTGDTVNILELLFNEERDYLIKHNNQQVCRKEQLAGKVIVLHFVSLVNGLFYPWIPSVIDLIDVYDKLAPKGGFEVVFVAVKDSLPCLDAGESTSTYSTPHQRFQERFSTMPWPAIPFSDLKSRKRLGKMFGIANNAMLPVSFVIDPRGVVLQDHATPVFSEYGSAGYPFTKERLECLDYEDNVAMKQLSISTLLASPERDYVITNKGGQVPLHQLEDKVVGLYFFTDISNESITSTLKLAYEELGRKMEAFEVVLIDLLSISPDTCEDAFWKTFETMPWLAIPFKDTDCCKKLLRIFTHTICDPGPDPVSKLVIIGPRGKFIEPCGANILRCYGIPAYPFTRFRAVNLKIEKVKDVKPETFWNLDAVFRTQNGSKVQFSQIVGKRIIILFQLSYDIPEHTLRKLKTLYNQMKGTDDEFEVIDIRKGGESAIPWLMHPPFDKASHAYNVMRLLFDFGCDGLVAFDCDGRIVRMTTHHVVGKMKFPFYNGETMEDEVLLDMRPNLSERLESLLFSCW